MSMFTTVVGSFPLENTPENFERAFLDQVNAGITHPCYPQLVDMNHQILDPMLDLVPGLTLVGKEFHLTGDISLPQEPVATEYGQQVLDLLEAYPEVKDQIQGIKACLTGPFTLCSNIILDDEQYHENFKPILFQEPRAHQVPEIVSAMASCVATITKAYKDMGFSIISIDDPFLSQIVGMRKTLYHEPEFILATLNEAAKYLEAEGSLHVCGILSPKLRDLLLDSTIHHLDHEFKTAPRNIDLFDREMLEDHGKILAFGSVQTNPVPIPGKEDIDNYVEPVEELVAHMTIAKERYGEENILIKPDCGFGGMVAFDRIQPGFGHEIVMKKLQNMVAAAKEVFG